MKQLLPHNTIINGDNITIQKPIIDVHVMDENKNSSNSRVISKRITSENPSPLIDEKNTTGFKRAYQGSEKVETEPRRPNDTVVVDFMDESFIMDDLKKQTKPADETNFIKSKFGDKNIDEIRDEIKSQEQQQSNKMSASDMENVAKFLINIIDTGATMAFRFWAKDTTSAGYGMTVSNKQMLTEQLTMILVKYQAKFSLEFMFLMALVLSLATPFMKARERKREISDAKRKYDEQQQLKNNNRYQRQSTVIKKTSEQPKPNIEKIAKPIKSDVDDELDDNNKQEETKPPSIPHPSKRPPYIPKRKRGAQPK